MSEKATEPAKRRYTFTYNKAKQLSVTLPAKPTREDHFQAARRLLLLARKQLLLAAAEMTDDQFQGCPRMVGDGLSDVDKLIGDLGSYGY